MRRPATLIGVLLALAAAPATAPAQGPVPPATPTPPAEPAPAPAPKSGKASVEVSKGMATRRMRFVARGQKLKVVGRVKPFVAGQVAVLEIARRGKVFSRHRAPVRRARRGGSAIFRIKASRRGRFSVRLRHRATPQQKSFSSKWEPIKAVTFRAGEGARGTHVLLLQRRLRRMGFAVPVSGSYGGATSRAVMAFRKTNNMSRTGYASPAVYSRLFRDRGAFKPRYPRAGRHVEYDWSRQVLALMGRDGRPVNVYHSSSGAPSTPTVFGKFSFYRKQPGTNAKGMVHSNYFIRGYAIHGFASVPAYPASHGCLRVPVPDAAEINRQISLGETIFVYR